MDNKKLDKLLQQQAELALKVKAEKKRQAEADRLEKKRVEAKRRNRLFSLLEGAGAFSLSDEQILSALKAAKGVSHGDQ